MFPSITAPRDLRGLYNSAAPKWHSMITTLGYADAYRQAISSLIPGGVRPHRVMDVGCGAGSFAHAYVQERGPVEVLTLADPAADMLHEAATRLDGAATEILLLDRGVETLPAFPSQDLILCAHVIEHCADPVAAIRSLGLGLSQNGVIVLIVSKPHWCNWLVWLNWRHRSYRPTRILEAIVAAGLVCPRDIGFGYGPPSRTSHAYLITKTQPEISYADCHR
jgi:ubiquinone/menaquinone biosynthesis C-methylase UbiE